MTKRKINDKFNDVMGVDPVEDDEEKASKALDMELWERKAIHDYKARGRVYRTFTSDTIDPRDHERISALLKAAESIPAIKAAFKPQTALGAKLMDIRARRVASGDPLLDDDEIEAEIKARRGGVDSVDTLLDSVDADARAWADEVSSDE